MIAAVLALVLGVLGVLDGIWRLAHGDLMGLVTLPFAVAFWYWIGMGAWRNAREDS